MANDAPENKGTIHNESLNHVVDLKKSFNPAVSLMQTIAQSQATDANAAASDTPLPASSSLDNK